MNLIFRSSRECSRRIRPAVFVSQSALLLLMETPVCLLLLMELHLLDRSGIVSISPFRLRGRRVGCCSTSAAAAAEEVCEHFEFLDDERCEASHFELGSHLSSKGEGSVAVEVLPVVTMGLLRKLRCTCCCCCFGGPTA
jgi:hypothetical protein